MSTTAPDDTVRPRAAWYLLVAVLWVGSAVVVGTVVATFVQVVDHGVTSFQAGQQVTVPDGGLTIYSRSRPQSRDCALTDAAGRTATIDGLGYDLNATFDGTTVYAVASTPNGTASGTYRIRCPGVGGSNQLYFGDRVPIRSILVRGGIALVLGLAGLAALIVLLVRRHTSRSQLRTRQLAVAHGYGDPTRWS